MKLKQAYLSLTAYIKMKMCVRLKYDNIKYNSLMNYLKHLRF
jgi:hypothetical protein